MPKKRGNNEGSITKRSDGRWMARVTVGRDPKTGQLKRVCLYGKTRQEVADQMARALSDKSRGVFVKPEKITVGEWLDTWLEQYKRPGVRPRTFDCYEFLIRCHLKPALGHIPLKDLRPENLQWLYNENTRRAGSMRPSRAGPGHPGRNDRTARSGLVSGWCQTPFLMPEMC